MWDLVLFAAPGLLIWAWFTVTRYIWRRWIVYQEESWESPLSYSWRAWQRYY